MVAPLKKSHLSRDPTLGPLTDAYFRPKNAPRAALPLPFPRSFRFVAE
jgi:hypothetical protein